MQGRRWLGTLLVAGLAWSGVHAATADGVAQPAATNKTGKQSQREALRQQLETSMLVTGSIDLNADGSVAAYRLDQADALAPGLRQMIDGEVRSWRFEPVTLDPGTRIGRANMTIRLVARQTGDGDTLAVRIAAANFGRYARWAEPDKRERGQNKRDQSSSFSKMRPPRYPQAALHADAGATVYLVLQVGADGRVLDAIAEQTNLRFLPRENHLVRWRKVFEDASLEAARKWVLPDPDAGQEQSTAPFSVRIPVAYIPPRLNGQDPERPGVWNAYLPGPRAPAPWITDADAAGNDAMVAGEIQRIGGGPKLLTPLNPQG